MALIDDSAVKVNLNNPRAAHDYTLIIGAFEKKSTDQTREASVLAPSYKDVYSTRNFSQRVQEQMNYYPGIHQASGQPTYDPFYTNAKDASSEKLNFWNNALDNPNSFMNGLRSKEQDFDYTSIFGSDASAEERAKNIGKLITECVPCFDRLLDLDNLLPSGDLLEVHLLNIKIRSDLLQQIADLFNNPGDYIDICELLNLLSSICPQDLLAMLALLTQVLAKMNLDVKFNLDFIVSLVGPILSPFLNALSQWLDKWIQLILGPMICVVDHINETIITAQQFKIPFQEARISTEADLGVLGEAGQTIFASTDDGAGITGGWSPSEQDRLQLLRAEKYKNSPPEWPDEEIEMSQEEMSEAWNPTMSPEERAKRNAEWEAKRQERYRKQIANSPILANQRPLRDGALWSNDEIPNSEKYAKGYRFGDEYYPPERQARVLDSEAYFNPAPVVNSIVQLRNILQMGIQYVDDWFTYITQMIYDLLGTDFGWMQKKTGSAVMRSQIVKLIILIKSILQAWSKNGLQCGVNSNLDIAQMKYIFENSLNKYSDTKFEVLDNGDIRITPPGTDTPPEVIDNTDSTDDSTDTIDGGVDTGEITDQKDEENEQETEKSGIIRKNCLKDLSADQLSEARKWISEYEERLS
jgi:hypothetical protein